MRILSKTTHWGTTGQTIILDTSKLIYITLMTSKPTYCMFYFQGENPAPYSLYPFSTEKVEPHLGTNLEIVFFLLLIVNF